VYAWYARKRRGDGKQRGSILLLLAPEFLDKVIDSRLSNSIALTVWIAVHAHGDDRTGRRLVVQDDRFERIRRLNRSLDVGSEAEKLPKKKAQKF